MASIAVNPLILKDVVFSVGTDDYQAHVSSVVFTPNSSVVTWKGLTPSSVHSAGTSATWTCDLNFIQDWSSPDSLSSYLYTHAGEEVSVTFQPISGSGPSFTATLIVADGAIGGAVDTFGETSVSLGSKGKPVLVPAGGGGE